MNTEQLRIHLAYLQAGARASAHIIANVTRDLTSSWTQLEPAHGRGAFEFDLDSAILAHTIEVIA